MRAIEIIHDEHRSMAAVLHGMLFLIREIRLRNTPAPFDVLGAMIHYIDAFPERFHHPKEDAYLFKRLVERLPGTAADVERVASEHRRGAEMIRTLEHALFAYQHGGNAEFSKFAEAAAAYAAFHWEHMRFEEDVLIPMARTHLKPEDWDAIDSAFLGHADPLFGTKAKDDYDALFRRIVTLAPPPIGVGPPR
jgi:hemerythrin-like domain-containing protein